MKKGLPDRNPFQYHRLSLAGSTCHCLALKRPLPDSNRGWRICNPLPYRLAKGPLVGLMLPLQSAQFGHDFNLTKNRRLCSRLGIDGARVQSRPLLADKNPFRLPRTA